MVSQEGSFPSCMQNKKTQRSWFLVVVVILLLSSFVYPWRRRRRRRAPPPPPQNCEVSAWGSWSTCSEDCAVGKRSRYRSVVTNPRFGGSACPSLNSEGNCGETNGGCSDVCLTGGKCACVTTKGYELQGDGKTCADKNECADGTAVCRNSKCKNTDGDYTCECLPGYQPTSNPRVCEPKSCTPLTAPQCPADAYSDAFGATCMSTSITCPDGYEYLEECTLTCPRNYKLAVISRPRSGQQFAQNFTTVDFQAPSDKTVCTVDNSGAVHWDWDPVTTPYYCRRVNDPPASIALSNAVINEKETFLKSVGKLTAKDPQNDHVTFNILNAEGNHYFLIQGNLLLIKTRIVWDPARPKKLYPVVLNASDNGSPEMFSLTTFNISVLNINDAPRDLEISANEVFENVKINYTVGNLTAIDDDIGSGRISNFSWELVDSDNGFFKLRGNEVLVAKTLDHETTNIHNIQVRCTDFGIPRKSSSIVSMLISVRDSNDSPKYIELSKDHVDENSPPGTVVGDVTAKDDDNDTLLFALNGTDENVLGKFALKGAETCKIRLEAGKSIQECSVPLIVNGSLDYEDEKEYIIWVAVKDPGGTTHKSFKVFVKNVNERPTDILITENRVPENSLGGTMVGEFLVKDPDNKNDLVQTHQCTLINSLSGDEDSFYISQADQRNRLRVKANKILDFETKKFYNITVTCKDTDLSISKSFVIEITDVNEPPTSLLLSNTSVEETNSIALIFIADLSVEDPDGTNQTFTYSVRNSFSRSFRISKDQLFLIGPLDFERTPTISVELRVTDNGGLYFEKTFQIQVEDVNDIPTNIVLEANSTLAENSVKGVFISAIKMIDEDSDTRSSCQLLNSSNDRVSLNGLNLLVGPTKTDYESLDSTKTLQISITCSDQHNARVTSWISLPVEDVNEPPTDLTLTDLEIRENKNNTLVGILEITDPDVGQRHHCTILNATTPLYIDSSENPSALKTIEPLDFESRKKHNLEITCEDSVADPRQTQHSTAKSFTIHVVDVNERPVVLCNTSFHVSPSFSRGSIIGQIQGYDPDNEQYHKSKKQNPGRPFEKRKQILSYRLDPENNTWPFQITTKGILYLEKKLNADEYNSSIILGIRVDDDGMILERKDGSLEYQRKKDEVKYSVHQCSIVISTNASEIDINLSSNMVSENATNGTVVGRLSRFPLLSQEHVKYHIIHGENDSQLFEIDGDILKLKLAHTLDYEKLPEDKSIPVTVTSIPSGSRVFTKQFLIEILDVNEMPTAICLISPRPLDACTVVGYILIEDHDYPEVQCEGSSTKDLEKISDQLSEYACHVQQSGDTLSNAVKVDHRFYIKDTPPTLYVNKTIFAEGEKSYNVPIVCQSTLHVPHSISTILNVDIKVPNDANCRNKDLCKSCPQPTFCLSHVQAAGTCVGEEYRINSTVNIPVSIFQKPGFIPIFENYVTSLIEGNSQGKTLAELVQEFSNENEASQQRRRREASYDDVYVELFNDYKRVGSGTNVVFAAAEKPGYKLILASEACKLLLESEVSCVSDGSNTSANTGGREETAFPMWVIYVIVAVLVLALIIALIVLRRRRQNKSDNSAVVHFARDTNTATVGSMYETPVDNPLHTSLSHSGTSDPVLIEKRQDIKVFHNPTYRSQNTIKNSESGPESQTRTMNHYEHTDPPPVYESIDDDLYEKVNDEKAKHDAEVQQSITKPKAKKSRSNPVYDVGGNDDSLNPVVNLSLTSPRRLRYDEEDSVFDENESDTTEILSTFKSEEKPGNYYENAGMANPLYSVDDATPPVKVEVESSQEVKNDQHPLEHQDPFEKENDSSC